METSSRNFYQDSTDILDHITRKHIINNDLTKSEKEELEDTINDLKNTLRNRVDQLIQAQHDKKNSERRLKIFMKVLSRFVIYEEFKKEVKKIIVEEKNNIKFTQFFGHHTNQLQDFENQLEEFE